MRGMIALGLAVSLAGCSKRTEEPRSSDAMARESAAATADNATEPRTGVGAVAGIAYRYGYAFRVPGDRIARAQEDHAAACEALGPARCRILGLHYETGHAISDTSASLDLKLDAAVARRFGSQAAEAVAKHGGKLASVDIGGSEAGAAITAIDAATARQRDELKAIEARLATLPASARDRITLAERAQALRDAFSTNADNRRGEAASLASTPMHIDYRAADLIVGLDPDTPGGQVAWVVWQSLTGAIMLLAILIAAGLPFALIAIAGWWLWRWIQVRSAGM